MNQTVHILATVRKPELLPAALLVFSTLRVGFPTATICVWGNGLDERSAQVVSAAAQSVGGAFLNLPATSHDAWIEGLLLKSVAPFWICDTDIVLHSSIESFVLPTDCALAGRFEPAFDEEWTRSRHVARLHTCLQWFHPERVRSAMHGFIAQFPAPWRNTAQYPFVRQHFVPVRDGQPLFYDSTAGLYQAGIGSAFTEAQNEAFDHLCFATYLDQIAPHLQGLAPGIADRYAAIYENPALARGIRHEQNKYYLARGGATPGQLRQLMAGKSADELVRMSHQNRDLLLPVLAEVAGGRGLEIGAWKGESTVWFLEGGLAHMDVIEPFTGNPELTPGSGEGHQWDAFHENTQAFSQRITLYPRPSAEALAELLVFPGVRYDFIYVDGSHEARDVALDALLSFKLLKPGGLIVFDDYWFDVHDDAGRNPRAAIDFFIASHATELTVLRTGYQLVARKLPVATPTAKEKQPCPTQEA